MLKKPAIWAEIGEIDGFIAFFIVVKWGEKVIFPNH